MQRLGSHAKIQGSFESLCPFSLHQYIFDLKYPVLADNSST